MAHSNCCALAELVESESNMQHGAVRGAKHSNRALLRCTDCDDTGGNDDIVEIPTTPTCVGSAAALQAAVTQGGLITLCYNSRITLSKSINLSGTTVDIRCEPGPYARSCRIEGPAAATTHFFWGVSTSAKFTGITFSGGNFIGGQGGALDFKHSIVELDNCGVENSKADVRR
jgi:hypothetical protein